MHVNTETKKEPGASEPRANDCEYQISLERPCYAGSVIAKPAVIPRRYTQKVEVCTNARPDALCPVTNTSASHCSIYLDTQLERTVEITLIIIYVAVEPAGGDLKLSRELIDLVLSPCAVVTAVVEFLIDLSLKLACPSFEVADDRTHIAIGPIAAVAIAAAVITAVAAVWIVLRRSDAGQAQHQK